jgi:UDP-N-acetylglucosamine 2-epimerase (non-hydrolysing)/GDP/UDP-N,N'-diacetylbacillosamine 2-epimerase (hydrolysing)
MNVVVVTGTRAEYGILTPVLRCIAASKKLRLQLVVTGMHLLAEFGATARQIKRDGFVPAATVPMYRTGDAPAESLARGTGNLARAFKKLSPDIVLVLGDRLEILAAAQAAMCCQIPIAHVHGGETAPGQFDQQIRHAVTKLAHVHFAATAKAAARIRQMGENPKHIHITGAPALDAASAMVKRLRNSRNQLRGSGNPLLVLHPMQPDEEHEFHAAGTIIAAIHNAFPNSQISAIAPNNDPGHAGIFKQYARQNSHSFRLTLSATQADFWQMLWAAPFLIGNSSSGIIEAATFGTPVINIGGRQAGRERGGNVIDVPCESRAIRDAIHRATSPAFRARAARIRNPYGAGRAGAHIVKVLHKLELTTLSPKQFFDL